MTELQMEMLTQRLETDWRSLIEDHRASTPFHSLAWKNTIESTFGYNPDYRLWYEGNEPVAALPAFDVPGIGGKTLTNPFCEYGHPIAETKKGTVEILEDLKDSIGRFNGVTVKDATWTGVRGYSPACYGGVGTGTVRRLVLDRPFEDIREFMFDPSLRHNVRKAKESGLRVEPAADSTRYYDIYLETMERLGSPQFPPSFLDALDSEFGTGSKILLALDGTEVVAGLHYLQWEGKCYLWSSASNSDVWDLRPNDLLYAEAVRRASETGAKVFDFGRSEPGSGVDKFKRNLGGAPYPLTSYVYPARKTPSASVSSYKQLAPLARALSPIVTHPSVGPRLKRWIHE